MMLFLKKLHKWVGLLVVVQVLLWLLSGLMISLIDPLKVSGQQWASPASEEFFESRPDTFLEPGELGPERVAGALSIELIFRHDQPVYHVKRAGSETLINAIDGSVLSTGRAEAERLARDDFTGEGEIISVEPGVAPTLETRSDTGAFWKVSFSDDANTTLYISEATGEILERRNDHWRLRDFFWMLHIMDYQGRKDFNNALIITVACVAIWLGISGFLLLFSSFNRHDFYFLNIRRKPDQAVITLIGPENATQRQLRLRKGSNLFVSLASHDIELPSMCGGGGECGKCRVKMEAADLPAATSVELGLIPRRLRERGFRLACQHDVQDDLTLWIAEGKTSGGATAVISESGH